MNQPKTPGQKRVETLLAKDPNYFKVNGAKGGSTPTDKPKGAAWLKIHDPEKLIEFARLGGQASRGGGRPRKDQS